MEKELVEEENQNNILSVTNGLGTTNYTLFTGGVISEGIFQNHGLGKLGRQGGICGLKKRTIHGTFNIFLGIKLFFCQDRNLKFSAFVWFEISRNLTKFQLI